MGANVGKTIAHNHNLDSIITVKYDIITMIKRTTTLSIIIL